MCMGVICDDWQYGMRFKLLEVFLLMAKGKNDSRQYCNTMILVLQENKRKIINVKVLISGITVVGFFLSFFLHLPL